MQQPPSFLPLALSLRPPSAPPTAWPGQVVRNQHHFGHLSGVGYVASVDADEIPPTFGPDFLAWLKDRTERAWAQVTERSLSDYQAAGVGGTSWRRGTLWTGGLSEAEITAAERRHRLTFPADYRIFLRTLHATTPWRTGARFADDRSMRPVERPAFFDWRHDDDAIRAALAWPLEGLLFDVENNVVWPEAWGPRPTTPLERKARLEELVAQAPRLVPVVGHRYIVPVKPHVVLSVYQSDIIVYGSDLRSFLLAEFASLLALPRDPTWGNAVASGVPFWGGLSD